MPIGALTQHCPIVVSKTKEEKILHNERVLQIEHSSFTMHVAKGEGRGEKHSPLPKSIKLNLPETKNIPF